MILKIEQNVVKVEQNSIKFDFLFLLPFPIFVKKTVEMAQEIERKFLVRGEFREFACRVIRLIQGYLSSVPSRIVRVRICNEQAFLTIKGKSSENGLVRYEWEKEISVKEAQELLQLCEPGVVEKTRYLVPFGNHHFEVDEFHGRNEGLILAEVELTSEQEKVEYPEWLGKEVTGDIRYYNAMLSKHPFSEWK